MRSVLTITLGTAILLLAPALPAAAADAAVPSKPSSQVDDRAGKLDPAVLSRLEQKLKTFEEGSTTQILVSIFPQLPEGAVLEEFTHRTAEAWGIGQKGTDNGVVLFVFVRDRKLRIEVGYGLEGAIPDATAKNILDAIVSPRLRVGDFNGAMEAGAGALMEAARGEYVAKSPPKQRGNNSAPFTILFFIIWGILFFGGIIRGLSRGATYRRTGRRGFNEPIFTWGGSGFGGGGGGGFSGGGGSFGGGGASGGW